jgi:hypothetical protein
MNIFTLDVSNLATMETKVFDRFLSRLSLCLVSALLPIKKLQIKKKIAQESGRAQTRSC